MEYSIADFIALTAHSAPDRPLSTERAHRVMQMHTDCSTDCCRNKRAAYDALVRAGHLVPDSCRRSYQASG